MKTVFKVRVNEEKRNGSYKSNITNYDRALAMIFGFISWIKEINMVDDMLFEKIKRLSVDWHISREKYENLKLFCDLCESFAKGYIDKDVKYISFASAMSEYEIAQKLKLLEELKELILNFKFPESMYNIGYYQAKIKGDNHDK